MTPTEFFKLSQTRIREIAMELHDYQSECSGSHAKLLEFAKYKYAGKEYIFAVNYCGYLYGFNSVHDIVKGE